MALLKLNVDFDPMVIGVDTRDSCSEKRVKGDPQDQSGEEAPESPAQSERLERKSTGKINRAKKIMKNG
jgi:hypothetical protein